MEMVPESLLPASANLQLQIAKMTLQTSLMMESEH